MFVIASVSEAIQSLESWIASSLALLAMTESYPPCRSLANTFNPP